MKVQVGLSLGWVGPPCPLFVQGPTFLFTLTTSLGLWVTMVQLTFLSLDNSHKVLYSTKSCKIIFFSLRLVRIKCRVGKILQGMVWTSNFRTFTWGFTQFALQPSFGKLKKRLIKVGNRNIDTKSAQILCCFCFE